MKTRKANVADRAARALKMPCAEFTIFVRVVEGMGIVSGLKSPLSEGVGWGTFDP